MKTLGTTKGIVLIFGSLKELHGVIEHLSGMAEWIESEGISSPHLYALYDDRIPSDEINDMLDGIKNESNENK